MELSKPIRDCFSRIYNFKISFSFNLKAKSLSLYSGAYTQTYFFTPETLPQSLFRYFLERGGGGGYSHAGPYRGHFIRGALISAQPNLTYNKNQNIL